MEGTGGCQNSFSSCGGRYLSYLGWHLDRLLWGVFCWRISVMRLYVLYGFVILFVKRWSWVDVGSDRWLLGILRDRSLPLYSHLRTEKIERRNSFCSESWFESLVSDHDFGVWFQIAGFVLFYQLSAGKQLKQKHVFCELWRVQLSTPFWMTSKFTNRLYSTIDDSHGSHGIRLDDIPISPGSAFESLDVLLGVRIREHRKRGGCCEIQECLWQYSEDTWYFFWWTVEYSRGSYNQKSVADWFWTSPFCKWPGWYGLSRNRLWLGLGKYSATTLLYGSKSPAENGTGTPKPPWRWAVS